MRRPLVVGILRETRPEEFRAPLTPIDVLWLKRRKIEIEIESSPQRIFKDREYKKCGAEIVNKIKKASLLVGIKEPEISDLYNNKIYMVFSHTIKGQPKNMPLLRECIKRKITLIDYERIVDTRGKRLVYFGRFAGICGAIDSLYYLGKKYECRGIHTPLLTVQPANLYNSLKDLKKSVVELKDKIFNEGFDRRISPFIIGITGHGNVAQGVEEILSILDPVEIHPKDISSFVKNRKVSNRIYKIVFFREEKLRSKEKKGFYFEEYLMHPEKFESNLDVYLPHLNILIHTSYWDGRYPRLVTVEMVRKLYDKNFRLAFIGDISCDIRGSIELTYKTTTIDEPTYTYDPKDDRYVNGYRHKGITVLARDNLPTELPKDASKEFSLQLREYVYQLAAHGVKDITNHIAIPRELRQATVVESGRLTKPYIYLKRFI